MLDYEIESLILGRVVERLFEYGESAVTTAWLSNVSGYDIDNDGRENYLKIARTVLNMPCWLVRHLYAQERNDPFKDFAVSALTVVATVYAATNQPITAKTLIDGVLNSAELAKTFPDPDPWLVKMANYDQGYLEKVMASTLPSLYKAENCLANGSRKTYRSATYRGLPAFVFTLQGR